MELDKQLFRNYNELYALILCCYKDISILKAYEKLQKENKDLYDMVPHISNHFVVLVQKDLALTLWKIYYDIDSNANTVPKFRNAINELLRNKGCGSKQVKQEKINSNISNTLGTMRRKFLAHADMKRNGSKIDICELKDLLDKICKEFNKICEVVDNDKISGISEIKISCQDMDYYPELLLLYDWK